MKTIATIAGIPVYEDTKGRVSFLAGAQIDCDGGSNPLHDPCWQPDTSLKLNGKSIDAESVPFIVVPPSIISGVKGIVLGCHARVTNTRTKRAVECVVADIGPKKKLGELSVAAAKQLGIPASPINGGTDDHVIYYELWPGVAAVVSGVNYRLQSSR
jgi:Fungal chitosanase of glycosyl hydrolase group 75